ncbi:hypothetical protein H8S90_21940 [Olivibacter sp. SDN3]|nr:hypothetical protein H8S90_21940 [Olivibacter sp. SDN3]
MRQKQAEEKRNSQVTVESDWKGYQKILFRVVFIFFMLMSIPWRWSWYTDFFSIDWLSLHYRDLYDIARFQPSFPLLNQWLPRMYGYSDWIVVLVIAIIGGGIWSLLDKNTRNYTKWHYWLLVAARYRAGIGIIGFAFTKVLPVQMPYPSEGLLNTNFGDLTQQKIYWLSIGIVPWYQVFTGVVELLAGTMLFFRKTTVFGAALLVGALGSITYVNFAYEGGVHVYASYFVLFGLFILSYYVPRIYRLMILEQYTVPFNYYPRFDKTWQHVLRFGLKAVVIIVFLGILFYVQLLNFWYDPYKQPSSPGLSKLRGYYEVKEFLLNNEAIAYNPNDTVRWQDLTFEKWTTMTFKVNNPQPLDLSNGGGNPIRDIDRTFEVAGVGGGRRVFHYYADTVERTLYLQDKNIATARFIGGSHRRQGDYPNRQEASEEEVNDIYPENWISEQAWQTIGEELNFIDHRGATARRTRDFAQKPRPVIRKKMILRYDANEDGSQVILEGLNENRDSIKVVLERRERNYILTRSTLDAGKYGGGS